MVGRTSIFRSSFLFSVHQARASATLPRRIASRMRLMLTNVSTSTRFWIFLSRARSAAVWMKPWRSR